MIIITPFWGSTAVFNNTFSALLSTLLVINKAVIPDTTLSFKHQQDRKKSIASILHCLTIAQSLSGASAFNADGNQQTENANSNVIISTEILLYKDIIYSSTLKFHGVLRGSRIVSRTGFVSLYYYVHRSAVVVVF